MKTNRLSSLKYTTKSLLIVCIINSFTSCVNDEILTEDFITEQTEAIVENEEIEENETIIDIEETETTEEVSSPVINEETTEETASPEVNEETTGEISTPEVNEGTIEEPQITTAPTNEGSETVDVDTRTTEEVNTNTGITETEVTMTEEEVDQNLIDARALLVLVNEFRNENGLHNLVLNTELNKAALNHSTDMNVNNYFSHTGLDGSNFVARIRRTNYTGSPRGENIAFGQPTVQSVHNAWINSEGHKNNILNSQITEMGLGHNGRYWTQVFGTTR